MSIHKLSEAYSVSGQIFPENLSQIAQLGFKSVICNRPDGEGTGQPAFSEIEAAANAVGITAKYMPVTPGPATLPNAEKLAAIFDTLEGPVFAFCGSGARSSGLWNLYQEIRATNQSAA